MTERRSDDAAGTQLDWVEQATGQGVGARQATPSRPGRGGGYLHECIGSQLLTDARIRELADMGMPDVWLKVAHSIGFDAFMLFWRVLDAEESMRSDSDSAIEIRLRRFRSFERYQRNRLIESLVDQGLTDTLIRECVRVELGEELSLPHIGRLAGARRVEQS